MTPSERIREVRRELHKRGFTCLSTGGFGLPSYTHIEAWANGPTVVYLVFDLDTGGWDILSSIDHTNEIAATWAALDRLKGGAA